MPVISKEMFYNSIHDDFNCRLLHYWTPSCLNASAYFLWQGLIGCSKFFLPIYIIKAVVNWKDFKLKKILLQYARTCLYAIVFITTFFGSNCLLCKLFGRLHYYNLGLTAGTISAISIFLESPFNRNLNTIYFFNCVVEAAIANLRAAKILKDSQLQETAVFMLLTSLLMYLLQTQQSKPYNNLWFYPHQKSSNDAGNSCNHDSCQQHALKGFCIYFLVGYALETVKFFLGNMGKLVRNPAIILRGLIQTDNFKFGLVTGGFVTLYRAAICLLLKQNKQEMSCHHAAAGFLAGITYLIKPNIQFGITAFTTILQLLLQRFQRIYALPADLVGILFALSTGILVHNRIMHIETCPKYILNMIKVCANGLDSKIFNPLMKYVFQA